jgi:predicted transglutaminase-like cysteine proteinase
MFAKAGLILVLTLLLVAPAASATGNTAPAETIYGKATPPVGYVHFCATGQDECNFYSTKEDKLNLTTEKWDLLSQVNTYVNGKIKPASDVELYHVNELWAYPKDSGDCEDYVLLKKRYLQAMGFSASNLLITVLLDENNDGHAVLTVVSEAGDFILDNRRDDILRWDQTEYKYLKRQSQRDPRQWVSLRKTTTTQVIVGTK